MIVVPGTMPATAPFVPTVATDVFVLDQDPPGVLLVSEIVKPGQTFGGPDMAAGKGVMVATFVA